jgi:predicted pyridoxine 5'-phosphate oxidase superfamily flavin-nucleotide-binding protein
VETVGQTLGEVKRFVQEHPITVVIGTADQNGVPHLAVEREIQWIEERTVVFEAWFCLTTVENLMINPKVAIAVWDQAAMSGYQLIGEMKSIQEASIFNGYMPGDEAEVSPIPPQAYRISIAIEEVLLLVSGPHADKPYR